MTWQIEIAANTRPRPDEAVGGDLVFSQTQDDDISVICIDVLGHGQKANVVAQITQQYLRQSDSLQPVEILRELDKVLSGNRGAAVAACLINQSNGQMTFAGVGNIAVRRIYPKSSSLVSKDGVVGGNMRQPLEHKVTLADGDIYLLHTDGVKSRFSHRDYPQIISDSAATAVAHILRHFSKQHDDAGCIVIKVKQ